MKIKSLFVFLIIINLLIQNVVFADIEIEEVSDENESIEYEDNSIPDILSKYCICIERSTEHILFEKDCYSKCAMASTTKILTGIIVIEKCNLADEVEISGKAAGTGGSTLGISKCQKITVEGLLYGLLLRSGNDCAVALAEYISGSVEEFCKLMNEKAKEIGLKNSNFVTPHGLDDDFHFTTAYDLAILSNYALNNEVFLKIVGTKQISVMIGDSLRVLNNTNELLGNVNGIYGIKTGFTGNAGRCLVTACKRNDLDVIIVVLGADTKNIRGSDTKKIINYVFGQFKMVNIKKEIDNLFKDFKNKNDMKVAKSLDKIDIKCKELKKYYCPIDKNKISELKTSIYYLRRIEAPIKNNVVIGKIRLSCDNKILCETDIYLNKKLNRIKWRKYLSIFVKKYVMFYSI